MADVTDWTDPCQRAARLREAYYALVSGTMAYDVSYVANGVQRSVKYSVIDTKFLMSQIREAEAECAALFGAAPRNKRYAIKAGARRAEPSKEI